MDLGFISSSGFNYILCPECKDASPEKSNFCIKCGFRLTKIPEKAPDLIFLGDLEHSSDSEFRFDIPEVKLLDFPPEFEKAVTSKRQKFNPVEGFGLKLVSFLLTSVKKNSINLKSLGKIMVEPRPYQVDSAVSILDSMGGSGILADEVGLGKTIEAGIVLKEMIMRGSAEKILILVPASLLGQWRLELKEKFHIDTLDETSIDFLDEPDFKGALLLSLHKAKSKKIEDKFLKVNWDLLLVDEAHSLKNHLTLAHKFVFGLKRKNTILLTATPIQNDLKELYNLINVVKPGYFKSIHLFRRKYMIDRFTPRNPEELRRLCSRVMVRHRRSDTLIKLPPREVNTVFVTPSPIETEFYSLTMEFVRRSVSSISSDSGDHIMLLLSILLKESTSSPQALLSTLDNAILPKIMRETESELLKKIISLGRSLKITAKMKWLIKEVESDDDPIIVYSEYLKTQMRLEELLKERGLLVHRYSGNLKLKDKEQVLEDFREKGGVLLSTEVGGQGLNLQHCHRMVNFDLPWNPMKLEQRIGRIHRFGQQEKVVITTVAGKGTFEEHLVRILISKIKLFQMVIGEIDSIIAYLKNPVPMEKRISRIIMESSDTVSINKRLNELAEEIIAAKENFDNDRESSSRLLDLSAEGENN